MTTTERPLENGWLPDTPVADTLLRLFVHNQGGLNALLARAKAGRAERIDDLFLADARSSVPYFNQAILTRPLAGQDDSALDVAEAFFTGTGRAATLLSIWPTADLAPRGWALVGHPALVARGPGPVPAHDAPGVTVRQVSTADQLAAAERVLGQGYPMPAVAAAPRGSELPVTLLGTDLRVRLGCHGGVPVAVGLGYVADGLVNLCGGATLEAARRRGVWRALVWARVADAAHLPAVAYTSDYSRPGFVRMGFLPITRFTLWHRRF